MSRFLLALSLLLAACPADPCLTTVSANNPIQLYGITGQVQTVSLQQTIRSCASLTPRATVQIITPSNSSFNDQALISEYDESGLHSVSLKFTPNVPGTWQLIVTFEPSLGRVQVPLEVAEERLGTARHVATLPISPSECITQPWRTTQGLVLCENGGQVRTLRPDSVDAGEMLINGSQVFVLGDAVWLHTIDQVQRWVDTGSELRLVASAALPMGFITSQGFTSETTAVRVFSDWSENRYDFSDGGLRVTRRDGGPRDLEIATESGDYVFNTDSPSYSEQICREGLDGGCQDVRSLVAISRDGLWGVSSFGVGYELIRPPFERSAPQSLPLAEGWQPPRLLSIGRMFAAPEAFYVSNADDSLSLMAQSTGGALGLVSYGPGKVLGTRGNFIAMQTGSFQVTFVEF